MIFDDTPCHLGEGAFWHPKRQTLYWFDILNCRLITKGQSWQFDENVSACGWIDHNRLLIAGETQLMTFDLETQAQAHLCPLEADNPLTRSNDGRADPQGGFWISTMGKTAEPHAGCIYRYYKGTLRKLFPDMTIPNAICFSPNGKTAYYTDTAVGHLMAQPLDQTGWPRGTPFVLIDLAGADFGIDGAVVAADGHIWNAQWGAARIAQYAPDGALLQTIALPAKHTTCPAFGGPDMTTLYCTSATQGIAAPGPDDGKTFAIDTKTTGQSEHQVMV